MENPYTPEKVSEIRQGAEELAQSGSCYAGDQLVVWLVKELNSALDFIQHTVGK